MVVTGRNSTKKTGLLDKMTASVKEAGIASHPKAFAAEEIAQLCRKAL